MRRSSKREIRNSKFEIRKCRVGFALYEVLIGVTIFAIGVVALGRAVGNCLNASALSAEEARVREILWNRMAEIQTTPGTSRSSSKAIQDRQWLRKDRPDPKNDACEFDGIGWKSSNGRKPGDVDGEMGKGRRHASEADRVLCLSARLTNQCGIARSPCWRSRWLWRSWG